MSPSKAYFFKGAHYVRWDIAQDKCEYKASIADEWVSRDNRAEGLKAVGFENGLDAAINWGNGKAYFFKGAHYVRWDIAQDKCEYKASIADEWVSRDNPAEGLKAVGFENGLDAAIDWKVVMVLSEAGARFIARFEGFRPDLYNDPAGHCTIGYGHLVHRDQCDGNEPAEFLAGITQERALQLLQADAAAAASEINSSVTVPLVQHQFDALVSFAFNVGVGAFRGSNLLRRLNAGEYDAVPGELNRFVHAGRQRLPGLVVRREAEGALFRDGTY